MAGRAAASPTRAKPSTFAIYLRTGQHTGGDLPPRAVEFKFNPYHDPRNGRFTGPGGSFGGGGTSGAWRSEGSAQSRTATVHNPASVGRNDPRDPANYTLHVVKAGDTLATIAALRHGVTADDLAWLNDLPADQRLRIGQQIKLPTPASRDRARDDKNRFLALDYYMRTHGGNLPPDAAHPPSLLQQRIQQSGWREIKTNGYTFATDEDNRTHLVDGDLVFGVSEGRSRANQARAGGIDRRAGDDGGHYVAVRFNGPRASFNHFAQDASFNRGAYRALEDGWARKLRLSHRVHVDIFSHYTGSSKRPDSLDVYWYVDGERHHRTLPNHRKG